MSASASPSLIAALHTDHPAPDHAEKMGLYGWLVGRWEMDAVYHRDDGATRRGGGEIHFGWVLAGRAIQDVWIVPPRDQQSEPPAWGDFYGTTLRVYDPGLDAWRILWIDPVKQLYTRQIGRARGNDIVQVARTTAAPWSAGPSPRSRPIHSIGSVNALTTATRAGDWRSNSSPAGSLANLVLRF